MRLVDLTRPIEPGMSVYPGDPEVRFHTHSDYAKHGFCVTGLELGTHAGTHLDAPAHFLLDGDTVEALPLEKLVGPARMIDLRDADASFEAGERVLIRSGWGSRWGEADYFSGFPGMPADLAERLAAAPVALVGLETPTFHPDGEEDARLHRLLLERDIVLVENLTNLDVLPERFMLAALPLPLRGLDGSPCRVVAWVGGDNEQAALRNGVTDCDAD
jgi:kynurenine formamidase